MAYFLEQAQTQFQSAANTGKAIATEVWGQAHALVDSNHLASHAVEFLNTYSDHAAILNVLAYSFKAAKGRYVNWQSRTEYDIYPVSMKWGNIARTIAGFGIAAAPYLAKFATDDPLLIALSTVASSAITAYNVLGADKKLTDAEIQHNKYIDMHLPPLERVLKTMLLPVRHANNAYQEYQRTT